MKTIVLISLRFLSQGIKQAFCSSGLTKTFLFMNKKGLTLEIAKKHPARGQDAL
ncbi:MAG: hypothetical protein IKR63_04600 [Alloprevotella sp.]|nr:hypothetical protein [Alloprevotella sp.]MBR6339393.1 hypothetical protein [Alloprevotella sp.]